MLRTFNHMVVGARVPSSVQVKEVEVEGALEGKPASDASIAEAARLATSGAVPLPMTSYKLDLLSGFVRDLLEQIAA